MQNATPSSTPSSADAASLSVPQWMALLQSRDAAIQALQHQLDWFKRQLFGQKSERFAPLPDPTQLHLGEMMPLPATPATESQRAVPAHTRRIAQRDLAAGSDTLPFFDEARVPVETIHVPNPDVTDLAQDPFEVIGEKVSYRLAQRPGSFVVLKVAVGSCLTRHLCLHARRMCAR